MTSLAHTSMKRDRDRRVWAAGPAKRADAKLRQFARREGDAVFCRCCDGAGFIACTTNRMRVDPIRKCPRCGGEGLEPEVSP